MEQENFYTEIYINAKPENVWRTFFSKDGFYKSFYGTEIQSTFFVGDKIEFTNEMDGQRTVHIYGDILESVENKILAYTDHPGAIYSDKHAELISRVRITFEQLGQATRLTLTNDQFSKDNPLSAKANQWWLILSNLKTFIETGGLMTLK
jgi:uncharacterized protein YndB with AHSA1/START domain